MHSASKCPTQTTEGKDDEDNSAEHKGFFVVEPDNPRNIMKFFGPMTVDVELVVLLQQIRKNPVRNRRMRVNLLIFIILLSTDEIDI